MTTSSDPQPMPPAVVAALYQEHHGWLYAMLYRRLGNSAHAADLVHDTFERLIRSEHSQVMASPSGYLATIARNLVRDQARRAQVEKAYLEALAAAPPEIADSPEQHIQAIEALTFVYRILDGLPGQSRSIFLLSQVEGLTSDEIAARLGLSVHSVRKQLTRSIKHCYLALQAEA